MLAGAPDTDFTDNLTFWTTLTSGQPITGGSANKQRAWDEVYVDMVKANLLSDCKTDLDHARLLAAFDQHSADWLYALPLSSCGLFLDNEAIRIAVALRLGATMCLPHDCQCGQTIDALGLHCFSCLKNSGKHTRHSILNDIVWRTMTRAKIQSIKEPLCLDNNGKRPDGASLIPWQRGKCVTWMSQLQTLMPDHTLHRQRFEPVQQRNGPP